MKLTKAKRREIYLKAAESIMTGENKFCCDAIIEHADLIYLWTDNITKHFPEFGLFEPKDKIIRYTLFRCVYFWFPEEQITERINLLLLCAELCKD